MYRPGGQRSVSERIFFSPATSRQLFGSGNDPPRPVSGKCRCQRDSQRADKSSPRTEFITGQDENYLMQSRLSEDRGVERFDLRLTKFRTLTFANLNQQETTS